MSVAERVLERWQVQEIAEMKDWSTLDGVVTKEGWFPQFALATALSLLLIAVAYTGARLETAWGTPLFWLGFMALLIVPIARLLGTAASRSERIGFVLLLGLGFYLLKVLYSPTLFRMGDELQHWRTTSDILTQGRLFTPNSLLPVSPYFPGLETVTASLFDLGNLSIFAAGLIVIAIARLFLVVSLYLFYEEISASARVAALGVLFYFANPHFVFFDAQFSYQSLALPLAIFVLYLVKRREREAGRSLLVVNVALIIATGAVIVTHHVTALVLFGFLGLWALVSFWQQGQLTADQQPRSIALVGLVAVLAWLSYMAPIFFDYIRPWVTGVVREMMQVLTFELAPRALFTTRGGEVASIGVQFFSVMAVLGITAALPLGIVKIWREQRLQAIQVVLLVGAILFPAFQLLRLTTAGLGIATRSNSHIFVGVAYVLAVAVVEFLRTRQGRPWVRSGVVAWAMLIFVGTMTATLAAWPLPGGYIAGNYVRSVDKERVLAAQWTYTQLGPGHHFAAPMAQPNNFLLGAYGEQRVITHLADDAWLEPLLLEPTFVPLHKRMIEKWQIDYVLHDQTLLPPTTDPAAAGIATPANGAQQTKFDTVAGINRIYDSGAIIIYDTGVYAHE